MLITWISSCILLLTLNLSAVAAFDPFSNKGVPPSLPGVWVGQAYGPDYRWSAGGVITEDGSFLFKAKGGNYANGSYSSWQWKEGSEREYYATSLRVTHDEDGTTAVDEVCEYGYVFGIVWTAAQSLENCPPAAGETQYGWRLGKVPVGGPLEQDGDVAVGSESAQLQAQVGIVDRVSEEAVVTKSKGGMRTAVLRKGLQL